MRADRLVSLVLLLRQRGQLTAATLAAELEVSPRTVLRDIEALSAAGVPVYSERGRHGGFALLPGFRTELMGLTTDETLALLTAGSAPVGRALGLNAALTTGIRKVLNAAPRQHLPGPSDVADRFLVEPEHDLLSRPRSREGPPEQMMAVVRRAVLRGQRLRIQYAAPGGAPRPRVVDPLGLVTVHDTGYLLALREGRDRTYRLSRISGAEMLDEVAERPETIDLERLWQERSVRFRASGETLVVTVRMSPSRREEVARTALAIFTEERSTEGGLVIEAAFQDLRHAVWALWQLGADGQALDPPAVRDALREKALAVAALHA